MYIKNLSHKIRPEEIDLTNEMYKKMKKIHSLINYKDIFKYSFLQQCFHAITSHRNDSYWSEFTAYIYIRYDI